MSLSFIVWKLLIDNFFSASLHNYHGYAGGFNAHIGETELREEGNVCKYEWGTRYRNDQALVELSAKKQLSVRGLILPETGEP